MKQLAALLTFSAALQALAHGGHAAALGFHWHPTDTAGFVLVLVLGAVVVWLSRRG